MTAATNNDFGVEYLLILIPQFEQFNPVRITIRSTNANGLALGRNRETRIKDLSLSKNVCVATIEPDGLMYIRMLKNPREHHIRVNGTQLVQQKNEKVEIFDGDVLDLYDEKYSYIVKKDIYVEPTESSNNDYEENVQNSESENNNNNNAVNNNGNDDENTAIADNLSRADQGQVQEEEPVSIQPPQQHASDLPIEPPELSIPPPEVETDLNEQQLQEEHKDDHDDNDEEEKVDEEEAEEHTAVEPSPPQDTNETSTIESTPASLSSPTVNEVTTALPTTLPRNFSTVPNSSSAVSNSTSNVPPTAVLSSSTIATTISALSRAAATANRKPSLDSSDDEAMVHQVQFEQQRKHHEQQQQQQQEIDKDSVALMTTVKKARELMTHEMSCSVCMDIILKTTVCNPCGHLFCNSCIKDVMRKNRECPNCRTRIQNISRIMQTDSVILGMVMRGEFTQDDCLHYLQRSGTKVTKNEVSFICFLSS